MDMKNIEKMKADYRFIRVIGEGAFSRVYLAEDGKGRRYACKVSREVKMLEREAEMLSRLFHPLFPAYVGYEKWDDMGGLLMEYIHGRSLGQMIRLRGRFSARQTMRFAEELADGLRYLHERQPSILYRDLKPENVMVCQDGHIKLVDMGCACYQDARSRARVGTPGFAPPEQLTVGGTTGLYSDVYSFGKTLQGVMTDSGEKGKRNSDERRCNSEKSSSDKRRCNSGKSSSDKRRCNSEKRRYSKERGCRREEGRSRRLLEHTITECIREDPRQRPQDMISVARLLTGKKEREGEILCEKNIWESNCKNACSLPPI